MDSTSLPGLLGADDDIRSFRPPEKRPDEASPGASSPATQAGPSGFARGMTQGQDRWLPPPVRRIEPRPGRKPVDPDKLPAFLRNHPRFRRP